MVLTIYTRNNNVIYKIKIDKIYFNISIISRSTYAEL